MTIEDIKKLIAPDEHRELELKKTTGELKDGMHSACAFMNTDGGWLLFGITPKSLKIVGEQVTDNTQREISMLFSTNMRNYPQFRLRMARLRGTDKNVFLDNMRAEGNFFDLLDAGMSFFFIRRLFWRTGALELVVS